jgi:hypothetical protein
MKQFFFYGVAIVIPLTIVAWFVYAVGRSLWTVFEDWRLGRELNQIEAESASRRQRRREENAQRLDNGCEHDFEHHSFGFPSGVCSRCGLEQEKPKGACDHVWRLKPGAVPSSFCEKCGRTYDPAAERGTLA